MILSCHNNIIYGTYKLSEDSCYDLVYNAIKIGYRIIDTAQLYKNQKQVGLAINKLIEEKFITRKDIFVISKVLDKNQKLNKVLNACYDINQELNLVPDLILLHNFFDKYYELSWKDLEKAVSLNLTKYIGLSNFSINSVQKILNICSIKPYVNQVELSLFNQDYDLINYLNINNIIILAHSIFTCNKKIIDKSLYDLCLYWCKINKLNIIIGTSNIEHLIYNFDIYFNDYKLDKLLIDKLEDYNTNFTIYKLK